MNTKDKSDNAIDEILKDVHRKIEPPDSWQALRGRIDHKIGSRKLVSVAAMENAGGVVFWRRLALGMAACFLITAGVLVYLLGVDYGMQEYRQPQLDASNKLLNQAEINSLNFAFSQVRQLFGQQSRWIMIGSGNSVQMGVTDKMVSTADTSKIIVVRLAINLDSERLPRYYFDVVTFSNQQTDFQLPLTSTSAIDISLKPILNKDGKIEVEIDARANGISQAKSIGTVVENKFTSLVRMRANGNWIHIDGVGQSMSSI